MKKIIILFLLLIPIIHAEQVYVIETNLETYNLSITEGYITNSHNDVGTYEVHLISDNEILHKQFFNAENTIEVFPEPECFDENMFLLEECEGIKNQGIELYERIHVPVIEGAEYIELLNDGKLVFRIDVREKNYTKYLIFSILGLIIIILFIFMRKYYKKQKISNQKVIQ